MRFTAIIPQTRRAFEIPGTRSELKMMLELDESQVVKAIRLILFRGQLFTMVFQGLKETSQAEQQLGIPAIRKVGEPVTVIASISSRESSIKINGLDGMQVLFAIPMLEEETLVKLLRLRERLLSIYIPEILSGKSILVVKKKRKGKKVIS